MSFVGSWVGGLMKGLGLVQEPSASEYTSVDTTDSEEDLDVAAQKQAASMTGGRTSTMLNGAAGVDDTKNTSKILLGR